MNFGPVWGVGRNFLVFVIAVIVDFALGFIAFNNPEFFPMAVIGIKYVTGLAGVHIGFRTIEDYAKRYAEAREYEAAVLAGGDVIPEAEAVKDANV